MTDYNPDLCEEKHKNIDKEFKAVWERIKTSDRKLWAIILLLVANIAKDFIK